MLDKIKTAGGVIVVCACVYTVGKVAVDVTGFVVGKICNKVVDVIDKKGKAE